MSFSDAGRPPRAARVRWAVGLAVAVAALAGAGPALAQPTAGPPQVIDGPTPAITGPAGLGLSIARDGTGGLVYLKGGHVYLSALTGGTFAPPQQLDGGLAGASSQPVIAADNGGELIVAFLNGGALYVTQRASAGAAFGAPRGLAAPAGDPSLQMTPFGKAYIAFTVPDGSGSDVRTAYYFNGAWALESSPLNATPGDDAGTGSGAPAVAAAGDGVAIVAWGENGHIYTRRVWGTAPSVVFQQADGPLPGCTEVAAGNPAIGSGGDSSYAAIGFDETLSCGGQTVSRVLSNRLQGGIDDCGYPNAPASCQVGAGSAQPAVAVGEYGHGWITAATAADDVVATPLGANAAQAPSIQVNTLSNASAPDAVPAIAGFYSTLIAFQHDPGSAGQPEIRVRFAQNGTSLEPEAVLSSPAQGPTDAAAGLAAAGDVAGEAAVAWVQTAAAGNQIVVDQLYQPPAAPAPSAPSGYVRTLRPVLSYTATSSLWGARYTVDLDGVQIAQTTATAVRVPAALSQGPHSWSVSTTDPAGLTSAVRTQSFFVDTVAPRVKAVLSRVRYVGRPVKLHVIDTDTPPGLPAADGSGIAKVVVHWGDGHTDTMVHWRYHTYRRPGRYRITVIVIDRAGNQTRVRLLIRVRVAPAHPPGQPKPTKPPNRPSAGATKP
jgi:hypothetical protein